MKKKVLSVLKWLIPTALVVLGVLLYGNLPTNFLGLVCFFLAVLLSCYFGIGLLGRKFLVTSKILYSILTSLVILGLVLVSGTGLVVGTAALGQAQEECQYIVVLGAKVNGTEPSRILQERIQAAYDYLMAHPQAVAVLSGGKGPDEGISEAQCMYNRLEDMGIDPARLLREERSTSTWENLNFSLELIEDRTGSRPERIGLVSSEFHLFRAGLFAKSCGVQSVGIPGRTENPLHLVNYFLREIAGVWHYFVLGG